jgi:thiol-disulfide isomerase/thioredoxin
MKKSRIITRREFVGKTAAAAVFTVVPRHVLGGVGHTEPSDKLDMAYSGYGILAIDQKAPAFSLMGIDHKTYTLESFNQAAVLTIVFTANHCPTAQAYEERMKELSAAYKSDEMMLVAISSNYPGAVCLEELGYSDLGDSFEDMKIRASDKEYNFPYLYDGEEQALALAYGALATPHVFIFDRERKLRYTGRIDDMEDPYQAPTQTDARNAIDALLEGLAVPVETTKAFGCSMKWKSKISWRKTLDERWKEKPVELISADLAGIKEVVKNSSGKFRLINVWATWCGPCIIEFPEFVTMQRMYGQRNFEMVSVSADKPSVNDKVKAFLSEHQAAFSNYIFEGVDQEAFINAIDSRWQGNLPYTMLVTPGGEVVYRHAGIIDPLEVKQAVVKELGRYFADDR